MALQAGQGGTVKVGASLETEIGVSRWKLSKKRALANVTTSKAGGIKQRKGTIRDQMVTLELPWDDGQDPSTIGMDEGSEIKVELKIGASAKKWTSNKVIIESVEYDNDEDEDVVRLVIVGYANEAFVLS
jgi:hypothetical protein